MTYYLDTSAAVKLVKPEKETGPLVSFLASAEEEWGDKTLVASDILQTELIATVLRAGMNLADATRILQSVNLLRLSPELCESAGVLAGEYGVRSLDAVHLASAISIRSLITGVITYDLRFADAAARVGFSVDMPQ